MCVPVWGAEGGGAHLLTGGTGLPAMPGSRQHTGLSAEPSWGLDRPGTGLAVLTASS